MSDGDLDKMYRLVKENNRMLHRIQRSERLAALGKVIRLVIFVGIAVAGYLFLQPYLSTLTDLVGQAQQSINQFQNVTGEVNEQTEGLQNLLDQIPFGDLPQ